MTVFYNTRRKKKFMKKTIKSLKAIVVLVFILVISISCDNDFTNIESDIQGVKNFEATSRLFPFGTRTQNFTPFTNSGTNDAVGVKTNRLNGNLFGVYTNPNNTFGTTVASFTAQVAPITFDPDFGDNNKSVESVYLNIPYFSTKESTDDQGNSTYSLDSIFGDTTQKFELSIYKSNYVLRDLDPASGFENPQCYYSNQGDLFESNLSAADLIYKDVDFTINAAEHRVPELDDNGFVVIVDGVTQIDERFTPGIRINLLDSGPNNVPSNIAVNATFWENIFFANQGSDVLSNRSNFKDFFKGLIIKVEPTNPTIPTGSLTYLNFNEASILFDYTNQEEIDAEAAGEPFPDRDATVYRLEFNDNIVNTFKHLNVTNNHDGDQDNLYLKGTDGSMAVIELFSGTIINDEGIIEPAFDYFYSKKDKWLINEANLVFYVNQSLINGGDEEPNRVTLYDLKNNQPIIDYFLDGSINTTEPTFSKMGYSELLTRGADNKGIKYKIRLTGHLTNILQNDSTNVKLGLFIANNVNNLAVSKIQGKNIDDDDSTLDIVPSTSVLTPRATILHGYDANATSIGRAEFEIFYTEPEN